MEYGIFVFSAKTIIEELKKLAPEIYHPCKSAIKNATRDLFFQRIDEKPWQIAHQFLLMSQ